MPINHVDFVELGLLPAVERTLRGLRFGSVEIVVHDGRVAHIERRERVRLDPDPRSPDRRERTDDPSHRVHRADGGPEPATAGETLE